MNGAMPPAGPALPGPPELANIVRRERSLRVLRRARGDIETWLKRREEADVDWEGHYVGRHETQRAALSIALLSTADALLTYVGALKSNVQAGVFFDECRLIDEAAVWLERVSRFYQEKFDQRDDKVIGPVVRAADEVVWSCYHDVMARALQNAKHRPAPLPYVSPEYSPAALASDSPAPAALRGELYGPSWTDDLRRVSRALPITLLRLPPWCVEDPWWLVFVAHEVGHHIQADLELTTWFADGVERAAAGVAGSAAEDARRWRNWSSEIFADLFSLLMIGPAALRALADVERGVPARMRTPLAAYPAPIVRLYLMEQTARRLGLEIDAVAPDAIEAPEVAEAPKVRELRNATVDAVLTFALGTPLPRIDRTLAEICGFGAAKFAPHGKVSVWAKTFLAGAAAAGVPAIDWARHAVAGSFTAWQEVASIANDADRETARERLCGATTATLARCAPPGRRAAFIDAPVPDDTSNQMVDALLDAARTHGAGLSANDGGNDSDSDGGGNDGRNDGSNGGSSDGSSE